jgi:glycosyltransferase involved in cell wall biosynthesis
VRILYVASDQVVPGHTGGSVHVLEVARGLAARGHEVHAVVHRQRGRPDREDGDGVHWHRIAWRPPHRLFRFRARGAVEALADAVKAEVVIERYYNFGGEGILAAARRRLPSLLEVNSPVVDHPGSLKAFLDALTVVRPLRARRERLCREATALVAPLLDIVPAFARGKTETVTWGADVAAFSPARRSQETRRDLGIPEGAMAVVFSGSFRPWHGVRVLEAAARMAHDRADVFFLLAGGPRAGAPRGYRGRLLGTLPYDRMPALLAAADVGVAPYDTARLRQLRLGFYWSPLKIFEYMASGLPVVTVQRPPLDGIVRPGLEGVHVPEADPAALARAIVALANDPAARARMGRSGRERVVERYSWARHCEQLEGVLRRIAS